MPSTTTVRTGRLTGCIIHRVPPSSLGLVLLVCLPSMLCLALLPPLFNHSDSKMFVMFDIAGLVPHWPPLYPLCCKLAFRLTGLDDSGLYLLLTLSHTLYCWGILYVARSFRNRRQRFLFALFMMFFIPGPIACHLVLSESLVPGLVLFSMGILVRDAKSGRPGRLVNLAKLVFVLHLLMGVRHSGPIFAVVPPLYVTIVETWRGGLFRTSSLRRIAIAVLMGLAAIVTARLEILAVCRISGGNPDFPWGRAGISLFREIDWKGMKQDERSRFVALLKSRCTHPLEKKTIDLSIECDHWCPVFRELQKDLRRIRRRGPCGSATPTADDCLARAVFILATTFDRHTIPPLFRRIRYFFHDVRFPVEYLRRARTSIDFYHMHSADNPNYGKMCRSLAVLSPHSKASYERIRKTLCNLPWFGNVPPLYMAVAALLLTIPAASITRDGAWMACMAFVLAAILRLVLISMVAVYMPRRVVMSQLVFHTSASMLATVLIPWNHGGQTGHGDDT